MHRRLTSFVRLPAAVLAGLCGVLGAPGHARTPYPSPLPVKSDRAPSALALPGPSPVFSRRRAGTGFFVDDNGRLVTAYHVVVGCGRVMVVKEDHHVEAKVVALSATRDSALLAASTTLGLAAVFPRSARTDANDMVFAAAYDLLPGLKVGGGVLANATVTGRGDGGELAIDSLGQLRGERRARSGQARLGPGRHQPSHRHGSRACRERGRYQGLLANGVDIAEDDRPQIAPFASRAHRAASISARVVCLRR